MHVSNKNPIFVPLVKLKYYDNDFYVVPKNTLSSEKMSEMVQLIQEIGDVAFIAEYEMYFSEPALFHLNMKYCDKYHFI